MTEVNDIREAYFREGESISAIAKRFSKDRKTVRKYIDKEDFNLPAPKPGGNGQDQPKLDPWKSTIEEWLERDKKAMRKQRHTAKRIYQRLVESDEEFNCSYRTVASYVHKRKKALCGASKGTLPLVHRAGEAQVDFGEAEFYENGTLWKGKYLNVSFPFSNAGYLQLFKGENRECLFHGLCTIFNHLGGVPPRLWFDNASTMVRSILSEGKRVLTEDFHRFKGHHGFEAAFCNPVSGNEKGHVENKVGYHRRNLLVPVPEMKDLEEYNRELLERCRKDHEREHYRFEQPIARLHEEDQKVLLPLPGTPFDCGRYEQYRTDGYGKIHMDSRYSYSTAPKYARGSVLVRITWDKVIPLDESHRPITEHPRLYGAGKQEAMDWIPYLTQLSRHPGALKYSGIYEMLPDSLKKYLENRSKGEHGEVLKVLAALSREEGFPRAVTTVTEAVLRGVEDLDSLVTLHKYIHQERLQESMKLEDPSLPELPSFSFSSEDYDAMLRRAERPC